MQSKNPVIKVMIFYILFAISILIVSSICDDIKAKDKAYESEIIELQEEIRILKITPTPTPTSTPTPTPTNTPTPTPKPTPICQLSNQEWYDECVARGLVTPAQEDHISVACGVFYGESGRETYYNLKMDLCVWYMRELGYDEEEYPYWIRDDGAKMLGNYVMCAANWKIRPKGTILPTSLGDAIVVDTGDFVSEYPNGVDLAVDW